MSRLINQSMYYKGVCRTAPAAPGLLISGDLIWNTLYLFVSVLSGPVYGQAFLNYLLGDSKC